MFTKIKNYHLFTIDEKNEFLYKIEVAKRTGKFEFLNNISLEKTEFYWCYDMNTDNGVMGCYAPLFYENAIFIIPLKSCKDQLVSTIIHELRHLYQYKIFGNFYYLLSIPGIRQITIEPSAKRYELLYDKLFL